MAGRATPRSHCRFRAAYLRAAQLKRWAASQAYGEIANGLTTIVSREIPIELVDDRFHSRRFGSSRRDGAVHAFLERNPDREANS